MARKKKDKLIFKAVEVIDAGARGISIGKTAEGQVILIPNVVPGDVVDVQTFKKKKSYYEGKPIHFHQYSTDRIEPVCEHFGVCGGCKWQNMTYEKQLFFKEKEVYNNLKRIGKIELPDFEPILGSENTFFYRNKMEFSFSDARWLTQEEIQQDKAVLDKNALGFHIPGMWDKILDIKKCHLQADPSNKIRNEIKKFAIQENIPFYNARTQQGFLRTLMMRNTSLNEWMVLLQFFYNEPKNIEKLMTHIANTFPQITSLLFVINPKGNDTLYDQQINCFRGRPYIVEEMEGLQFMINAKSFYQTNASQAHELYKITRDFADLKGDEIVYDLYTGTGTIAQFISKKAKKVVGIEAVPEAIEDAKTNALNNSIKNCVFFVGDMKKVLNDDFITSHGQPDIIITDPPREGMHKEVVEQILKVAPQKVVYVSCNSATQARDVALMDEMYKVKRVRPVDMFPQTHHVENVVLLEKRA